MSWVVGFPRLTSDAGRFVIGTDDFAIAAEYFQVVLFLRSFTGVRIGLTGAANISRVDGGQIGPYRLVSVHLHGRGRLHYTIRLNEAAHN